MNAEKLSRLQASVRIGGKGTPRRKVKKVHHHSDVLDKDSGKIVLDLSDSSSADTIIESISENTNELKDSFHGKNLDYQDSKEEYKILDTNIPQISQDKVQDSVVLEETMAEIVKETETVVKSDLESDLESNLESNLEKVHEQLSFEDYQIQENDSQNLTKDSQSFTKDSQSFSVFEEVKEKEECEMTKEKKSIKKKIKKWLKKWFKVGSKNT